MAVAPDTGVVLVDKQWDGNTFPTDVGTITGGALGDNTEISPVDNFTLSGTTSGAYFHWLGTRRADSFTGPGLWVGIRQLLTAVAFAGEGDPCTGTTPPEGSDTPFWRSWPFPVGYQYARENWAMDIRMIRGDNFGYEFTVYQADGTPKDITGLTFTFSVKRKLTDAAALFTRTVGTGITLTDPTNGKLVVTIPPSATSAFPSYKVSYEYDLQLVESALPYTIARGKFIVSPDVTTT